MTAPAPRAPVIIPSKSRATTATTPRVLRHLGVPYRLIVEDAQHDEYAAVYGAERLLVLPQRYVEEYDPCVELEPGESRGSGPARNYAWDVAREEGAPWHWLMDDNIQAFYRLHRNKKVQVADGMVLAAMESFISRYENVALAGPDYDFFVPARKDHAPFRLNTRVFSCLLIRTDSDLGWRSRYNEDLDLSIRALKAGWTTVLFHAFLQKKIGTQLMAGGNTEAFYAAEGTWRKSETIVRLHPDVVRHQRRYGRDHHLADFSAWEDRPLRRRPDAEVPPEETWRSVLVPRTPFREVRP